MMLTFRLPLTFSPGESAGSENKSPRVPAQSGRELNPNSSEFPEDSDAELEDDLPDDEWEDEEDEDWDDEEDADWDDDEEGEDPDLDTDDDWDDEEDVALPAKFRQAFRPREELPRKRKDREE